MFRIRFCLPLLLAIAISACNSRSDSSLKLETYNPGEKGIFPVSSVLITGQKDALLVDAQFRKSDAEKLVEMIKKTEKTLKTVYISHSDSDNYFGLKVIKDAFPDVKILATSKTVATINADKDSKLEYWKPILKDEAPASLIVPDVLSSDSLELEGEKFKIIGLGGASPDRTSVWIEPLKAIVGGPLVEGKEHVWLADTQTVQSRQNWLKALDEIEALKPEKVIPGHYAEDAPMTLESVRFTRDYIKAFEAEADKAQNAAQLIEAMKHRYPDLKVSDSDNDTLTISAKVIKGEMLWPKPPFIGKSYEVRYTEEAAFRLDWESEKMMTYTYLAGPNKDAKETIEYSAKQLGPNLYKVSWQGKDGATVVHTDNYNTMISYSDITLANGQFLHWEASMKLVK